MPNFALAQGGRKFQAEEYKRVFRRLKFETNTEIRQKGGFYRGLVTGPLINYVASSVSLRFLRIFWVSPGYPGHWFTQH